MYRVNAQWQNWPGAPGLTTFFQDPAVAQPAPTSVYNFFFALRALLPSGLTITVPASGDLIEESTGQIAGTWSATPVGSSVIGTGTGVYAGNAGAVVHWLSSTVVGRRRLRGRSFLVPLVSSAFEANGSLASTTISTIETAATSMMNVTAGHFVVWHRPKAPVKGAPPVGGSKGTVTAIRCPDLAISLRSRRV